MSGGEWKMFGMEKQLLGKEKDVEAGTKSSIIVPDYRTFDTVLFEEMIPK